MIDRPRIRAEVNLAKIALGIGAFLVSALWLAGGQLMDRRYYPKADVDTKVRHASQLTQLELEHIKAELDEIQELLRELLTDK
jgi:hypothetical protein